jgi:hypothetical protein
MNASEISLGLATYSLVAIFLLLFLAVVALRSSLRMCVFVVLFEMGKLHFLLDLVDFPLLSS